MERELSDRVFLGQNVSPFEDAGNSSDIDRTTSNYTLHQKQHFHRNAQRKYQIFEIFCIWRKYLIFCKTKIKENIIFSIIFDIFHNKSIKQDNDKKEEKY